MINNSANQYGNGKAFAGSNRTFNFVNGVLCNVSSDHQQSRNVSSEPQQSRNVSSVQCTPSNIDAMRTQYPGIEFVSGSANATGSKIVIGGQGNLFDPNVLAMLSNMNKK